MKRIKLSFETQLPVPIAPKTPILVPHVKPPIVTKSELTRENHPEIDQATLEACGVVSIALPFQRTCIAFLNSHKNVALLDAMGLGKTFQVLCAIRSQPPSSRFLADALKAGRYRGNTLVVCPKIVQHQWLEQHAKHLRPMHKAIAYTSKTAHLTPLELCQYEIIVVTYDFLRSITAKNPALVSIQFWRVVLDEAHCVKNHASKRFEYIDLLECTRRVALSGTPMHNTLTDLFPMLRFFRCFKGSLAQSFEEWRRHVVIPSETNQKQQAIEYVQTMLEPFVIRRLKTSTWRGVPLLSALPQKVYKTIDVRMTPDETNAYNAIERGCIMKGLLVNEVPSEYDGFRKLHALRLCCVAPTLKSKREDFTCTSCENAPAKHTLTCTCTVCESCVPKNDCPSCDAKATIASTFDSDGSTKHAHFVQSSKLKALETYIHSVDPNDKVIVFSSWVIALDAIQSMCSLGKCARLDGSMPQSERLKQLDLFRSTHNVLLMTFGAGSTGIDLTCANHVVFVDPHWSPAIEMQAEDRAYRIGQTKPVYIVHLIQSRLGGAGTIEHVVRGVQRKKRKAMNDVFKE